MNKKKKKKRPLIGVTVGGPTPGIRFQANLNAEAHVILLPNNPFYCAAVYRYNPQLTALREMVAVFSHCVKREE